MKFSSNLFCCVTKLSGLLLFYSILFYLFVCLLLFTNQSVKNPLTNIVRQLSFESRSLLFTPKDLHRTGCTNFSGHDNAEERAVLKRVLLAYARWNKHVGYCQGFNVIAALLLDVMNRKEDDALKVNL